MKRYLLLDCDRHRDPKPSILEDITKEKAIDLARVLAKTKCKYKDSYDETVVTDSDTDIVMIIQYSFEDDYIYVYELEGNYVK